MNTTPTTTTAATTTTATGTAVAPDASRASVSSMTTDTRPAPGRPAPNTPSTPKAAKAPRKRTFPPRVRKTVLILHVISSLTWLGVDVGLLALSLTGLTTDDPMTLRAVYLTMSVLVDAVVIPAGLLALTTGVVLSLGTKWGLVRYRWVLVKLVITLVTVTLTYYGLRAGVETAAAEVRAAAQAPSEARGGLLFAPIVSLTCYVFMTVISFFKPWGRTRWGRTAGRAT
jgi:hypothetical protein